MSGPDDHIDPSGTTITGTNPYLAIREEKIARNQARLRELGLISLKPEAPLSRSQKKKTRKAENDSKQEPVILRRSGRVRQVPAEWVADEALLDRVDVEPRNKRPRQAPPSKAPTTKNSQPINRPPPKANSVKTVALNTEILVLGNDQNAGVLGLSMEQTGKDFVIHESFRRAASKEDQERLSDTPRLSFNKYSGVQEWGGNVLFLWVNFGAKAVVNDFLDGGRQITWFGGSRMHDESPVIQQLLRVGLQATATSKSSGIVLWCRTYRTETKGFGPYTCLGRLAYQSHAVGSSPLSFVWNLLDFERLKEHPDETVRQTFEELVSL
jgi:hypothetical protein